MATTPEAGMRAPSVYAGADPEPDRLAQLLLERGNLTRLMASSVHELTDANFRMRDSLDHKISRERANRRKEAQRTAELQAVKREHAGVSSMRMVRSGGFRSDR